MTLVCLIIKIKDAKNISHGSAFSTVSNVSLTLSVCAQMSTINQLGYISQHIAVLQDIFLVNGIKFVAYFNKPCIS